jgi:Fic family protein
VILSSWNQIFAWIPIETIVYERQQEYYDQIEKSRELNDSQPFISFMMQSILDTLTEFSTSSSNETVNLPIEERILLLLESEPDMTVARLVEITQKSRATVSRKIKDLRGQGILERVGSDRTGYWLVKRV